MSSHQRTDALVDGGLIGGADEQDLVSLCNELRAQPGRPSEQLRSRVMKLAPPQSDIGEKQISRWRTWLSGSGPLIVPALAAVVVATIVVLPSSGSDPGNPLIVPADLGAQQSKAASAKDGIGESLTLGRNKKGDDVLTGTVLSAPSPLPNTPTRQITTSTHLYVPANDFNQTIKKIWHRLRLENGYVQRFTISGSRHQAELVLKVPAARATVTLASMSALGTITNQEGRSRDLGALLEKLSRRASRLQEEINRLQPMPIPLREGAAPSDRGSDRGFIPTPLSQPKHLTPAQARRLRRLQSELGIVDRRQANLNQVAQLATVKIWLTSRRPAFLHESLGVSVWQWLDSAWGAATVVLLGLLTSGLLYLRWKRRRTVE